MLRKLLQSLVLSPNPGCDVDDLAMFRIAENEWLLHPSIPYFPTYHYQEIVQRVEGKRAIERPITGHPDLHHFFWFEAGNAIPDECRWVFRGNASFIHPETKIVFAIATGTHDISIRVPTGSSVLGLPICSNWTAPNSKIRWVQPPLQLDVCQQLLAEALLSAGPKFTGVGGV